MLPVVMFTELEVEQYRERLRQRQLHLPGTLIQEHAFIQRRHTAPLVLYRTVRPRPSGEGLPGLKANAVQQIGVVCDCGEGQSLESIRHDFARDAEWNDALPETTRVLFDYIGENLQSLIDEMLQRGELRQFVLQ